MQCFKWSVLKLLETYLLLLWMTKFLYVNVHKYKAWMKKEKKEEKKKFTLEFEYVLKGPIVHNSALVHFEFILTLLIIFVKLLSSNSPQIFVAQMQVDFLLMLLVLQSSSVLCFILSSLQNPSWKNSPILFLWQMRKSNVGTTHNSYNFRSTVVTHRFQSYTTRQNYSCDQATL